MIYSTTGRAIIAGLMLFICNKSIASELIEGYVVSVHDGDTVTLLVSGNQQLKIRLAQIDAPESDQPFGQKSKQSLASLVFNKSVTVEKEAVDKYGRTVGTIFIDSIDVNKAQVRTGMAWAYRQYLHDTSLIQEEENARQSKLGLWSDPNPIPPWEYRHAAKNGAGEKLLESQHSNESIPDISCGSKRYCKEMTSCDEAKFYLNQCGLRRLDGDGDGVPCEQLCR